MKQKIIIFLFLLTSFFACKENKELPINSLWFNHHYHIMYLKQDTIMYYPNYCPGNAIFVKQNDDSYRSDFFAFSCLNESINYEKGYNQSNSLRFDIEMSPIDATSFYVHSKKHPICFATHFGHNKSKFERVEFDEMQVKWDSLVIRLFDYKTYNLFTTSFYAGEKQEHNTKHLLNFEQEIWLLAQENKKFAGVVSSHFLGKYYTLYHEGEVVSEKRVEARPCYFKSINKLVFERYKKYKEENGILN